METYTQDNQLDWLDSGLLGWDGQTYTMGNLGYAEVNPYKPIAYNFSFALDYDDYDYIKRFGVPYDGMMGFALNSGDLYQYDGLHGFWSSIKSGFQKVGRGIKKAAKATWKGIKKVGGVAKGLIKRWGLKLAPIVSFIPAVGPAIASGLVLASTAIKLYDKYKSVPKKAVSLIKGLIKKKKKKRRKIKARAKARKMIAARAGAIALKKAAKRRKIKKSKQIQALVRKEAARKAKKARIAKQWATAKPGAWGRPRKVAPTMTAAARARPMTAARVRAKKRTMTPAQRAFAIRMFKAEHARQRAGRKPPMRSPMPAQRMRPAYY